MPPDIRRDAQTVPLAGGAEVTISLFVPDDAVASIVCLPALGVPASYYEPLALALAAHGLAAVTADLRGLGLSSVRPKRGVDFGYARLVEDAAAIVASVRERLPSPVLVLGHSLGGHVGSLLAGTRPEAVDALVLCACGTPHWRRFPPSLGLRIMMLSHLADISGRMLGFFPGQRIGFGGTEAAQLMREWSRLARGGMFRVTGLDAEAALASVSTDALVISLEGDWMAPKQAVDHLAGKLSRARVDRVHVTTGDTDPRSLDHFRWAKLPHGVVGVIGRWMAERNLR